MTRTFSIAVPHYQHDVTDRIHRTLLQQFDETFALSHKLLRRTDRKNVQFLSSAFRRLLWAISDLKPFISTQPLSRVEINIRGIADVLSEIRYQDVAIQALEEVGPQTPHEIQQTIEQFIQKRQEIRRRSRQTLERALVRLRENACSGESAITETSAAQHTKVIRLRKSATPLKNIASSIVQEHLTELEKCGRLLEETAQPTELGTMDRATQRVQCAIDLFSDCWTTDVRLFSRSLANLQRTLSSVSDCDTWIEELRKQILETMKTRPRPAKRAFVFLFTYITEARKFHFQESSALWNAWKTDDLSSELRKIISRSI